MTKLTATTQARLPVILVLTVPPRERALEAEREHEMRSLLDTASRSVAAVVSQHLQKPVSATCIGKGKIDEVAAALKETGATQVVFDAQLTPSQQRNLEEALDVGVLDYNELILDIFARNARTNQAILAVELAQLEYGKSRLKRLWTHLDRQAVGAGASGGPVRGPGEKQIEIDKRLVRKRILELHARLAEIESRKDRAVASRSDCFNVALVGYTNAGKSTLMNALTGAGVLAENRLFATLDTRTARLFLERGANVVLSDTVGFIRNLPPTLIASFHATLAEVREADLLLHVVDCSSPVMDEQITSVETVLKTIGIGELPVVMVFNKHDRCYSKIILGAYRRRHPGSVTVSALTGEGLDDLKAAIRSHLVGRRQRVLVRFGAANGALDAFIRSHAAVVDENYDDDDRACLTIEADERVVRELQSHPDAVVTADG